MKPGYILKWIKNKPTDKPPVEENIISDDGLVELSQYNNPNVSNEIPELPAEALAEVKTERGRVFLSLQDSLVPPAMRSFTVRIAPEGIAVKGEQGYRQASLAVQKANYAVRMYEKAAFKTVAENEEEYIMVCPLKKKAD